MKTINSKEAQNNFGALINSAIKQPVVINKHGKPVAVLISFEEYEEYLKLEDLYWELKAHIASSSGFLSKEESEDFLNKILQS